MISGVMPLVEFSSADAEVRPGDVIMTGSSSGNGTYYNRFLRIGNEMRGDIEGLIGVKPVRFRAVRNPCDYGDKTGSVKPVCLVTTLPEPSGGDAAETGGHVGMGRCTS